MKRSEVLPAGVSRAAIARIASLGLAVASLAGTACAPDQSVKPGAPELVAYYVVQAGPKPTRLTPDAPDCPTPTTAACNLDAEMPPVDGLCRDVDKNHWCNCIAGADPKVGAWNCDPFAGVVYTVAIFDRLLDTAPLDPDDPTTSPADVAKVMAGSATPVPVVTDYGANGTPTGLVIPLLAQAYFGNIRTEGPSLFTVPTTSSFPSDAAITLTLDGGKVRAKDGTTPFVGKGALLDGVLRFATAPFAVSLVAPDLTPMSTDTNTVTVAFTNLVSDVDAVVMRAHATVNGAPAAIVVVQVNEATMTITPDPPWPAGATVVVTLDPGVTSVAGDTLATAADVTFVTPVAPTP